jgi:solute carrier family 39 (zinc transporter), member 9
MLLIEQFSSGHAHHHSHGQGHMRLPDTANNLPLHNVGNGSGSKPGQDGSRVEFDADLADLEGLDRAGYTPSATAPSHVPASAGGSGGHGQQEGAGTNKAFPLTFGLVVHGLADGLALGASALSQDSAGEKSNLSLIVFIALAIHKGMLFFPNG